MRKDKAVDGLINDKQSCYHDEAPFHARREKFGFAVAIRMIHVARLRCNVKAEKADEAGNNVGYAFECVGENGHRIGQKIRNKFDGEQQYCYCNNYFLSKKILLQKPGIKNVSMNYFLWRSLGRKNLSFKIKSILPDYYPSAFCRVKL